MSAPSTRVLALGSLLAAWAGGVGIGVLLGQSRAEEAAAVRQPGPSPAPRAASGPTAPSTPSATEPRSDAKRLAETLARREAELRSIERQIDAARQRPPGVRTRDDKLKLA